MGSFDTGWQGLFWLVPRDKNGEPVRSCDFGLTFDGNRTNNNPETSGLYRIFSRRSA